MGAALEVDQWHEAGHLIPGVLLVVIAHQVGEDCLVVGDSPAHGDRDVLTFAMGHTGRAIVLRSGA